MYQERAANSSDFLRGLAAVHHGPALAQVFDVLVSMVELLTT